MRTLLYLVTALVVMVLAFWAYRENYATQAAIDRMQGVQTEIAGLRERLGLLRAEWAYLNRPDRLQKLVDMNFDKLRLVPLQPGQFAQVRQVPFPAPGAVPADGSADALAEGALPSPLEPSQNIGAPPRRPAVSATTMNPDAGEPPVPETTVPPEPAPPALRTTP